MLLATFQQAPLAAHPLPPVIWWTLLAELAIKSIYTAWLRLLGNYKQPVTGDINIALGMDHKMYAQQRIKILFNRKICNMPGDSFQVINDGPYIMLICIIGFWWMFRYPD